MGCKNGLACEEKRDIIILISSFVVMVVTVDVGLLLGYALFEVVMNSLSHEAADGVTACADIDLPHLTIVLILKLIGLQGLFVKNQKKSLSTSLPLRQRIV